MNREYKRIVPGAKVAVLMIHGICGTPNHFRALLPLQDQIPKEWSVHNMVLDGHCKGVKDFGNSSMKKWQDHAKEAFLELSRSHEKVVLVGHSMGTLLSIQLSLQFPEKVAFLFLIAVPLRVGIQYFGVRNILRHVRGKLDMSDPLQAALPQVCGIRMTRKWWKYGCWLPRFLELVHQMHRTGRLLPQLTVPVIAYQSHTDELVSTRSRKMLEKSGKVEVHELQQSTHFYYSPEEIALVQRAFAESSQKYI